jgi:hypothetical protein
LVETADAALLLRFPAIGAMHLAEAVAANRRISARVVAATCRA